MAVVDPVPAMSVPVRSDPTITDNIPARRRKHSRQDLDTLDIQLLCSKLETFKREQEAAQVRREKRNAVRNGSYVPRSAAQSFAATTTVPVMDKTNIVMRNRTSAPAAFVREPLTTDSCICKPPKELYAALNIGFDDDPEESLSVKVHSRNLTKSERVHMETFALDRCDSIASMEKHRITEVKKTGALMITPPDEADDERPGATEQWRVETKRPETTQMKPGSIDPSGQKVPRSYSEGRQASSPKSPRTHDGPWLRNEASSSPLEPGRGQCWPGDAAKRRSVMGPSKAPGKASERAASYPSIRGVDNNRVSRFLENETSLNGPIPELEEIQSPKERPKLVVTDRPDWSQKSDNGVEMRHTLHFFHKADKVGEMAPDCGRKRSSMLDFSLLAPFVESKSMLQKKDSNPQNDHMIADAVRIIKQEERLKRRASVIGFFKKL